MSLKQEKPQGALDPAVVLPPPGCKIYYGHSRYEPKWCSGSLRLIFVWLSENRESGASDHEKKQTNKKKRVLPDPVLTAG